MKKHIHIIHIASFHSLTIYLHCIDHVLVILVTAARVNAFFRFHQNQIPSWSQETKRYEGVSEKCVSNMSHEKNPPTFHYTGWLIGILTMVYYNPNITG